MADKSKDDLTAIMQQLEKLLSLDALSEEKRTKLLDHLRREFELLAELAKATVEKD